jgi:hypothetical protein
MIAGRETSAVLLLQKGLCDLASQLNAGNRFCPAANKALIWQRNFSTANRRLPKSGKWLLASRAFKQAQSKKIPQLVGD